MQSQCLHAKVMAGIEYLTQQRLKSHTELGFALPGGGARKCSLRLRHTRRAKDWVSGTASGNTTAARAVRRAHRLDVRKRAECAATTQCMPLMRSAAHQPRPLCTGSTYASGRQPGASGLHAWGG